VEGAVSGYDLLRRFLSDRPIAFHPELARAFGGINEALFFQQIAYWSDKGSDPDWIYKTQPELEAETCLSRYQQEQARKKLKSLEVLREERRGVPARLYYRVEWEAVFRLLETRNQDCEEVPTRLQETDNLDREDLANQSAGNSRSIPKNTTEKTRETEVRIPQTPEELDAWEREQRQLRRLSDYTRRIGS
jgi:hypothetical protein